MRLQAWTGSEWVTVEQNSFGAMRLRFEDECGSGGGPASWAVRLDGCGLRALAHRASKARGKSAKSGPLWVAAGENVP